MIDWNAMGDDAFRAEVRCFYAEHFPPKLRDRIGYYTWAEQREWYRKLYEKGWAAPSGPVSMAAWVLTRQSSSSSSKSDWTSRAARISAAS